MKPLSATHSIWEIINHIIAWEKIVLRRLQGEELTDVAPEEDWPPVIETNEEAWQSTLKSLEESNRALRNYLATLSDERLQELIPGQNVDVYTTLHGVIQHDLYHAGQRGAPGRR